MNTIPLLRTAHPLAKQHGRHHLLGRSKPYCVRLQNHAPANADIPCWTIARFLEKFPTVQTLAAAPQGRSVVVVGEAGLLRPAARNLHKAAQQVVRQFGGTFPSERKRLGNALRRRQKHRRRHLRFSFQPPRNHFGRQRQTRTLPRVRRDGNPQDKKFENSLSWTLAENLLPSENADATAIHKV